MCRGLAPNAELASIYNKDVHTRLVSLVTNAGNSNPVLTWIGGIVKASMTHICTFNLGVQIKHYNSTSLIKKEQNLILIYKHTGCSDLFSALDLTVMLRGRVEAKGSLIR